MCVCVYNILIKCLQSCVLFVQAGAEGSMMLGLVRTMPPPGESQACWLVTVHEY